MSFSRHAYQKNNGLAGTSPARRAAVSRIKLMGRIEDIRTARLTYVQTPAGYGKSSLLLQWAEALAAGGAAVAMIACEAAGHDAIELLGQAAQAIQASSGVVPPALSSFLAGHLAISAEQTAKNLAQCCADSETPIYLFLDDAHLLSDADAVRCLRALIEHAPPQLHFVIAAREKLDLPLARWRAFGELTEFAARDLEFSREEIRDLFAQAGVDDLKDEELRALEERTEGWGVALRLAAIAMAQRNDRAEVLNGISGERSEIWDFFAEDVLARQPAEVQDFLLKISILDKFTAPLCDAVTGVKNGREMLARCEQAGLFLLALDGTRSWYRLHTLFREFLARAFAERLAIDNPILHGRASAWFFEAGLYAEAFDHALKAKDPIRAAEILDGQLDTMFGAGQARTVRRLAAEIPPHIQAFYPRIMLAAAWPLAMYWNFAEVRNLVTASKARIADLQRLGATPKAELKSMQNLLSHREMMLAQFSDDLPKAEEIGKPLMESYSDAHPFVAGSIYSAYLNSQRDRFKLDDVERLDIAATGELDKCEGKQVHIAHEVVAGLTRFAMGQSDAAIARLRNGLGITNRIFGEGTALGSGPALLLAEALYERNALDEARALIALYLPRANEMGFVDQLIAGWLTQARLRLLDGDGAAAFAALDSANAQAAQHGFERLALAAAEERVRILLRGGRLDEAARAARRAGVKSAAASVMPTGAVGMRDEMRALLWLSWAETQNRVADALSVARQWRAFIAGADAVRAAIRWEIRIAHLLLLDGESRGAKRTLRRAIALAAPGRYIRSFLDEPALLRALFAEAPGETEPRDGLDPFTNELLNAFERERGGKPAAPAAPEREERDYGGALTAHELEVLRLTASGLTNREVGSRLGMTEGSIKWHLQQIYDKMGVRRRMMAVERAKFLGLIN